MNEQSSLENITATSGYVGYVWNLVTDEVAWFGPAQDLFGEAQPKTAKDFLNLIAHDDREAALEIKEGAFDRDYRLQVPGRTVLWIHTHGVTFFEDGKPRLQQGLVCPRTSASNEPSSKDSQLDPLTGRLNRSGMEKMMASVLKGAAIDPRATYFVAGIDKMAFLNEALGPKAIDALLCDVAARLQSLCPPDTRVGRVGGDLFGLLISGRGSASPENLARVILGNFNDTPFQGPFGPIHVPISIGSALLQHQECAARDVMIRAEQALREARNKGRNRHISYLSSPARAAEMRAYLEIGERVQEALRHDHLHLAYQPVIDAQTGEVLFYEALARLFKDDGKLMSAAEFIPVVEQQGLATIFDRHVLKLAIQELDASENVKLAVNISGLTASLPDWPEYMHELLAPRPSAAERLIIEITETAAILEVAETKILVDSLRALGSKVAIDDFGAGSTSIRHLRTLSLAIMKIDKELLDNLMTSPEQQHLVRMLISIARGLGLKTVAEGIETPDVAAWLKQERVDMMQGFYFGYPSLEKPWIEHPAPIFLTGPAERPKISAEEPIS